MAHFCPHCSRANLADAQYCHFDGVSLYKHVHAPAELQRHSFPTPFIFPSGLACKNFDDFANGCLTHWDVAVDMLQRGFVTGFFGGLGRMDLVQAAEEAVNFPDRDRGLDLLLGRLPTHSLPAPKLDVQPKLITLGPLQVGDNSTVELALENRGNRLIFGSIAANVKWLAVTDSGEEVRHFQFRQSSRLTIHVKGQHLRAGKPLEGTLALETNAGMFKLKVIAQVPIRAFPEGVLAGARTPRELAEKAKASPKQAAPLFQSSAVAQWYLSNGWIYPVQGQGATGMAALQQFFEALGLSKAPKVRLSESHVAVTGKPGAKIAVRLQLQGDENRPVFAHATSAASWLTVQPAILQGTTATLPFEITVPDCAETARTTLTIQANGNQRFEVPVEVAVEAKKMSAAAAAMITSPLAASNENETAVAVSPKQPTAAEFAFVERRHSVPPPIPKRDNGNKSAARSRQEENGVNPLRPLIHVVPLLLLGFLLFVLVVKDSFSDNPRQRQVAIKEEPAEEQQGPAAAEFKVAIQDEPDDLPTIVPVARFKIEDEPEERFRKQPAAPIKVEIKDEPAENNQAGGGSPINPTALVTYTPNAPPRDFGISCTQAAGVARSKRLTYARNGATNTTVVRVNKQVGEFGGFQGKWTRVNQPLLGIAGTPGAIQPSHSTWTWGPIAFHQVLEVVPGQSVTVGKVSRRNLDTVLVRWVIENQDRVAHSAGLRLQLDTLIGSNDGVPFTVPGQPGLVNNFADFRSAKEVPDFIQALENGNLKNPGTVAHMTLKVGAAIEAPTRLSLTHWPGASLAWDVPVGNMGADSAAILYWPDKLLKAGESRVIGFGYGLGNVAINDKLGLTLGGSFEPGQHFTLTAYVENPTPGQTLKLHLPDGLRRSDGLETQPVPPSNQAGRNTGIVTWKVLVERTGEFRLKVDSSTGLSQAKTISIAQGNAPTSGKLTMDLDGSFEPGKVFRVIGKVTEPIDNQTLSLQLPVGLERTGGEATQRVPAPAVGSKDSVVEWQVRVVVPGKHPVRVSSSTGVAQTKTITIVQPGRAEGLYTIVLTGDFTPGKVFTVSTKVVNPAPDQRLTLVLPKGLQPVGGDETQTVQPGAPLAWKVKIQETGKFMIGVKSTTGVTQRKTIIIEPPSDQAGRFTFDLVGDIRPGKDFRVTAEVAKPLAGQTLTLVLPKGLQLTGGDEVKAVGAPANPDGVSTVAWNVRVTASGRLPVRIESSTGLARTKTINLTETNSSLFGR